MTTGALLFMIITEVLVTGLMLFFFIKVLTTKPRREPDSYSQNDEIPR